MAKNIHEVRDPVHVFVRMDSDERKVLDSRPFQRLRHIHQLALTFLVYPGATHRRFEHSLGVMELASRVFDVITATESLETLDTDLKDLVPEIQTQEKRSYWKRVLRMAALCHDLGHLPFSHAAEKELLPDGWDHEKFTRLIIESEEMQDIWRKVTPPLRSEDIVKLAVGQKKAKDLTFTDGEAILSEIIVGDAFGVDRMDYLLRDSHHTGVPYGRFDHYRLVDTLRILPPPPSKGDNEPSSEPDLGVTEGGVKSAEALLLARYFMYSQVYFHPIRRIYDIHLRDYLAEWLPGGKLSTDVSELLKMTDNELTAALLTATSDKGAKGHDAARRIFARKHFRILYSRNPSDTELCLEPGKAVFEAASAKFGAENLRYDRYRDKTEVSDFPVLMKDGRVASSVSFSDVIARTPQLALEYVFVSPELKETAERWLEQNRNDILNKHKEEA